MRAQGVRRSSRKQRGRTSKEGALEGMKAARARDAAAAADESADDSAGGLTAGQRARAQQRREAAEAGYDPAGARLARVILPACCTLRKRCVVAHIHFESNTTLCLTSPRVILSLTCKHDVF